MTTTMTAIAEKVAYKAPAKFGSNAKAYPSEMRTQMWPLCCGARIISGFKLAAQLSDAELDEQIAGTMSAIPDHQIFAGEKMKPAFTFLTLNSTQTASPKIMSAIERAGFKLIFTGKPRGSLQSWFLKDTSNTFQPVHTEG